MSDFPIGQERLLKQLVSTFRCRVCRRTFGRDHVRVTARQDELWIVSVRCMSCRNQQVFWVSLQNQEEEALLQDIDEAERFETMDPISVDDVLDMHLFLARFDGDFKRLFLA